MSKIVIVMCTEARGIYLCAFSIAGRKEEGRTHSVSESQTPLTQAVKPTTMDVEDGPAVEGGKASQIGHSTS